VLENQVSRFLGLLQNDGWTHQAAPDGQPWWIATYKTPRRLLKVQIAACDDLLVFQSAIAVQAVPACRAALYSYLLRLNNELRIVKVTLDGGGRVWLSAEIPLVASGLEEVQGILAGLRSYFEQYHREIELMASQPALATTWLALTERHEEEVPINFIPAAA
jgi:hypothetical protein